MRTTYDPDYGPHTGHGMDPRTDADVTRCHRCGVVCGHDIRGPFAAYFDDEPYCDECLAEVEVERELEGQQ